MTKTQQEAAHVRYNKGFDHGTQDAHEGRQPDTSLLDPAYREGYQDGYRRHTRGS